MKSLYIVIILLTIASCKSDDPVDPASLLPPITTTGENTFGCLIDGKFFRPRDGRNVISSGNRGLRILRSETNNIEIEANDFKSDFTSDILIHVENLLSEGEGDFQINSSNGLRRLDGNNNTYMHCRIWNSDISEYQVYLSFENSGIINISKILLDSNNGNIISGTFTGKLVNILSNQDTVIIDKGRFDINTITLSNTTFN